MLRVLGFVVVAGIAVLAIVALVALAIVVVRLIQGLLVSVAAAMAAGAVVWLLALLAGSDDALAFGAASALVTLPLIIWGRSRTDRTLASGFDFDRALDQPSPPRQPVQSEPEIAPEPEHDHAVTKAWANVSELLPIDAGQLADARAYCAQVLRASDDDGLDAELLDCAVLIRRHLPELVQRTLDLMPEASADERDDLARELVESLNAIGRRSEEALAEGRAQRRSALSVRHLHVRSSRQGPGA